MSTNSIFFSYSRDNSEFVLKLAEELREAGSKVWLDQLDIKPGTRWDKSIETALAQSTTVLVVLSKSSVASHNVMDEVSYALEEGKTVIPILMEDCEIPFRLRRLQFADFTISHANGMETLSRALKGDSSFVTKTNPVEVIESKKNTKANTSLTETQKSKKSLVYIAITLIVLVGIYFIYSAMTGGGKDMMSLCKADWEELETAMIDGKQINELAALRKHIELYAPCPHENEAMDRISFLKAIGSDTIPIKKELDDRSPNKKEPIIETIEPLSTPNTNEVMEQNSENNETPAAVKVTGLNVSKVSYKTEEMSPAGYFQQLNGKIWIENSLQNASEMNFMEIKRHQNFVDLYDSERDYTIRLDIKNKIILLSTNLDEEFGMLYEITESTGRVED